MSAEPGRVRAVMAVFVAASVCLVISARAEPLTFLVDELDNWIDANSELPRAQAPPSIRFEDGSMAPRDRGAAMHNGLETRGVYDPAAKLITLFRPWNRTESVDVSVLLHELIHHRQPEVRGHCPSSQEPQAYRLQARWLATRGIELDVDWISIELTSGCQLRDVHPDLKLPGQS